MAWFKGTATDWHDMMDQISTIGDDEHISAVTIYDGGSGHAIGDIISLSSGTYDHNPELEVREVASGDVVASIASIGAGGSGYAIGDKVEVVGGTYTIAAILEVTSVSGTTVTGLQVNNPGIYSVQPSNPVATSKLTGSGNDALTVNLNWTSSVSGIVTSIYITDAGAATVTPTNPVSTTSSGSGTGLQLELTWTETAWTTDINYQPQEAVSATISAGGSGYAVDDILTVVEGSGQAIEHTQFRVTAVSGTAVTSVSVEAEGYYVSTPSNPVSTSSTGGGSGCTLTVTWQNYATSTTNNEKHMIIHNSNENVYIGIRAYNYTSTDGDVWNVNGFSGFNTSNSKYWEQPGYDSNDVYIPLHDATFSYFLSIHDRYIAGIFNVASGTLYSNMIAGLHDPFMTEDEYPYPLITLGCISDQQKYTYSDSFGGMHNPGAIAQADVGPGRISMPDSSYVTVRNWYRLSGTQFEENSTVSIQPIGHQYMEPLYDEDKWYDRSARHSWNGIVQFGSTDSTFQDKLRRFSDEYLLIPCLITDADNHRFLGTLPNIFWFDNADGNLSSGDRIWINGTAYRVFVNCKLSNKNNMFCIKEG